MKDDSKTKTQLVHELAELRTQNAELKKSESSEKYRNLVESIRDVIYELDSQGVVLYISPAIRDLLGYDSAEIIGKKILEFAHKDDLINMTEWFSGLRKGEESQSEHRLSNKAGEFRWAQTKTRPIMEDGLFKGARGIIIDITEQRRVQNALKESEKKYRLVVDNMADVITVLDPNLRFTYVSPSIIRLRGYTAEEVMAQTLEQIMTPESLQIIARVFEEELKLEACGTAAPDRIRILELEEYRKDGSTVWLENHLSSFRDKEKKLAGIIALSHDITERKRTEETLKRTNTFLDSIIENIPNMIFLKDEKDLRFVRFNRAGEELLGYSRNDLLGKNDYDFFPKEQADHFTEKDREVLSEKKVMDIPEEILQTLNKGERTVHTKKVPLLDSQGKPEFLLGISEDITERKRAEQEILEQRNLSNQYLQVAGVMICALNSVGEITLINKKGLDILKYTDAQELLGKNWFEVILQSNVTAEVSIVFNQLMSGKINRVEYYENRVLTKYGDERIIAFHNTLLRDKEGKISGILFSGEDVTDRKRAEEELRKSEKEFRSLAEAMPQIVWVARKDGLNVYFNQQWVDYTGLTLEESYGHGWNTPFHPDDRQRAWDAWQNATKTGGLYSLECRLRRADGVYHWWLIRGVPSLDETGEVIKWFGTCTDIDNMKRFEEQLQEALESLRKAVGTTIQVMVSAVEARDPYTSGHQLRSANLARAIAIEMGLPPEKIEGIRMAGSIHDIGKLSIPAEILSKPTKLSEIEFSLIKEHSQRGYEMLKDVESPWPLADIIHQHHERMDGSGYPRNLKGEEILIEARILVVADVVEAMASHRPYRPGLGIDAALNEIEKNKGISYDDAVADVCLRLFREKGFQLEGA